ncbi:hypothetical protein TVAG_056600 [Trichomonas vaginalis G3]|uniref:Uncharacterized protein n=1 Tax=Trichomonas vaginalis (strain ATCC PRA-98 / G3) TaxID=412133 RepID=A2ECL9_TRIV3|nr:spectrin binding [Trichomonas vaginalis G3]EAY09616.1 hypothetical protein TVAG_056600 [Trichomonas vaginalis G3]KAI5502127.1 spectrin binding [Trichomonas vaginalis G3]|eukprot:XP_001321839.1 hypothetical protein [Trichomonas vaginalis G3]
MSGGLEVNLEYMAAHISDFITDEYFFESFELEDIKNIMKNSNFNTNDFTFLIELSYHTIKAHKLYLCARKANVCVQNMEDVILILKSIRKNMKLRVLNSIIDYLDREKKSLGCQEKVQKLQSQITQLNEIYNQSLVIPRITELKKSNEFNDIYNFLDQLSSLENNQMLSRACDEGLWKKKDPKFWYNHSMNVLNTACERGNLRLVKSLIECGCMSDNDEISPLNYAIENGKPEIAQYLISAGVNKEAKNKNGETPVFQALENG